MSHHIPDRAWWKEPLDRWLNRVGLGKLIQHVGEDVAALSTKVDRLATKDDVAAIASAVKALRDDLLKPALTITVGKPEDQEK